MYTPPTIHTGAQAFTLDTTDPVEISTRLAAAYDAAAKRVAASANANDDYLDPGSLIVRVTIEGRAL
jgi:hypothetical protein